MHAFEDTFGHRNQNNNTISVNDGFGHGGYGSDPDYTYNHFSFPLIWKYNENRTIEMEKEVYEKIKSEFNLKNAPTFNTFQSDLEKFNAIRENEGSEGSLFKGLSEKPSEKINLLNNILKKYHLVTIPTYNVSTACKNRKLILQGLNNKNFPGVILNTPHECPTERIE
ncbi:MAG: hypothetical protein V4525_03795 [Pseudomonadota bacterium]